MKKLYARYPPVTTLVNKRSLSMDFLTEQQMLYRRDVTVWSLTEKTLDHSLQMYKRSGNEL